MVGRPGTRLASSVVPGLAHPLEGTEVMADKDTPIPGGASSRNHFPQTVSRLAFQAARAVFLEHCQRMLDGRVPPAEVQALLDDANAEMRAIAKAFGK